MALKDKLKGLDQHRIVLPAEFDAAKADVVIRDLHATVAAEFPPAAMDWIRAERRDIWDGLCGLENAVDRAYLGLDYPGLVKAAELLLLAYRKAFRLFAERPPVIETQAEMFS